jgi:hypothetical protein
MTIIKIAHQQIDSFVKKNSLSSLIEKENQRTPSSLPQTKPSRLSLFYGYPLPSFDFQ